jgi:hypothetical protein
MGGTYLEVRNVQKIDLKTSRYEKTYETCEGNIKMDIREIVWKVWTGFFLLRIGFRCGP